MDERIKRLAPSILAGNHANLKDALLITDKDGREWIHLDIMDGHFVPNLSFGPQTVADLRKYSKQFFDVHLMLDQPDRYVDAFIEAGSDLINIHVEPKYDKQATLDKIKKSESKPEWLLTQILPSMDYSLSKPTRFSIVNDGFPRFWWPKIY